VSDAVVAPAAGAVIVFDGVCVLCNGWVRFLLRHDRRRRYRFAAMQGEAGRALLARHGLDPDDPVSFLLVEYDIGRAATPRVSTDTDAIRRVLAGLGGFWRVAHLAALLPGVARNRYRWFGRHEACMVPSEEDRARFL
jgi:predicted DCC family thiol-disulfide oxidoreductase YuxK